MEDAAQCNAITKVCRMRQHQSLILTCISCYYLGMQLQPLAAAAFICLGTPVLIYYRCALSALKLLFSLC